MEPKVNERYIQFAFINSRGNVNLSPIKLPFHQSLEVDQEVIVNIGMQNYFFSCVGINTKTNNDGTIDVVYVLATNHQ